jgi:EAL and modified HD-GYP domain-containing signal transduction protein
MVATENQPKILLLSQPIYNRHKEVWGFKLFIPDNVGLPAGRIDDSAAASEVLLNLATGVADQIDIYSRPMLVRLPDELLQSDSFLASLSQQAVIEIPSHIHKHDFSVNAIEKWRSYGYRFVLDGFDFSSRHRELLPLFDYLAIDAKQFPPRALAAARAELAEQLPALMVRQIDSEQEYRAYLEQDVSLFQGYFLARPVAIRGHSLRNKINKSIHLAHTITHPDAEIDELVDAVSTTPSLAAQILKIINSPLCGLKRPVESLRDAVVYLGLGQARKWIMLMAMMNTEVVDSGTIRLVLTRAKTCEKYAALESCVNPDQAFLAGLVSGVDLLFGIAPEVFLQQVSLDSDIETALLRHEGELGKVLTVCLQMERLGTQIEAFKHDLCDEKILSAYMEASAWAERVLSVLPSE